MITSVAIRTAIDELAAQLKTVDELGGAVATRADAVLSALPAAVIGPPILMWEGQSSDPTDARLLVYLVVEVSDRAQEILLDLLPAMAAAIDQTRGVVISAAPGSYQSGQTPLPAYEITIEVPL